MKKKVSFVFSLLLLAICGLMIQNSPENDLFDVSSGDVQLGDYLHPLREFYPLETPVQSNHSLSSAEEPVEEPVIENPIINETMVVEEPIIEETTINETELGENEENLFWYHGNSPSLSTSFVNNSVVELGTTIYFTVNDTEGIDWLWYSFEDRYTIQDDHFIVRGVDYYDWSDALVFANWIHFDYDPTPYYEYTLQIPLGSLYNNWYDQYNLTINVSNSLGEFSEFYFEFTAQETVDNAPLIYPYNHTVNQLQEGYDYYGFDYYTTANNSDVPVGSIFKVDYDDDCASIGHMSIEYWWDGVRDIWNREQIPTTIGWHVLKIIAIDSIGQTTSVVWRFNVVG